MTRPSRYPVASFGPELLAALIKGATETVTIPLTDAKSLSTLQMRFHMLRSAMRRERHPNLSLVERVRTSRQWDTDAEGTQTNFRLVLSPNDAQFASAISAAGVVVDTPTMNDVLSDVVAPETPADPSIQSTPTQETNPYDRFK